MPKQLAALIVYSFIAYLLFMTKDQYEGVSRAIWVPFTWMFLAGSRYISGWMNLGDSTTEANIYMDGSPVDRMVFMALIVLGTTIVMTRRVDWGRFIKRNIWLLAYFGFSFLSLMWSPYPIVSMKRLIKAVGNVIMVIILATEDDPLMGLSFIIRHMSFILIPLSFLFIKYYPEWGRSFHMGEPLYNGAMTQKNSLGQLCVLSGIYFVWCLTSGESKYRQLSRNSMANILAYSSTLFLIYWNLVISDSKTSLVTMLMGIGIVLLSRVRRMKTKPKRILKALLISAVVLAVLELIFNVSTTIIVALGRDASLTTRVPMWYNLMGLPNSFWLGSGYESFWLGDRLAFLWSEFGRLNNAHNGYLETFLNLGLIGLVLLLTYIIAGFGNIRLKLKRTYILGVLCLVYTAVILVYNWTEATFHTISNTWIILMFSVTDISIRRVEDKARRT